MKYLYVTDNALATRLIASGNRLLHTNFDIEQKPIWVFEYDPSLTLCFDINDTSIRRVCCVSDKFTMHF